MSEKGEKIDWTDRRWKAMLIYQRKYWLRSGLSGVYLLALFW